MKGAKSRLTIDLDSGANLELRAQKAYYALERHAADVEVRISSSGSGLHLIGYFDERLSDEQKERWRRHLGDDPKRVHLDAQRASAGHMTQVMWTKKGSAEAETDYETVEDALAAM